MIRKAEESDRSMYLAMAHEFYHSPAVLHPVPDEHFERTFDICMKSSEYAECYILELDGEYAGYGLIAKTWSQEAGGLVYWIEEIYVRGAYRSKGLGQEFFKLLEQKKEDGTVRFRLEVEADNERAMQLYTRMGYEQLDYLQMFKEF